MFARYAPLLARSGASVVLEVQSELKEVLSQLDGVTVVARGEALPRFEVHCPLGSLPLALKTEPGSVPADIPYLRASEERIAAWRPRMEALGEKRVALVWAGNPAHVNDRNRSIALARLAPLLSTPGITFVGLQRDVPESDRAYITAAPNFVQLGGDLRSFADTSAVVALACAVVAVDTSAAHLAAAMGRPTFLLLPFWPDWRWTLSGDASPWYPHVRLFRQGADGDWDRAIARVRSEIAAIFAV
jgi:hypothetical protein